MKVGNKVKVVKDTVKQGASGRFLERVGVIVEEFKESDYDFEVNFGNGDFCYFNEDELEVIE